MTIYTAIMIKTNFQLLPKITDTANKEKYSMT